MSSSGRVLLRRRLGDPSLTPAEREFIEALEAGVHTSSLPTRTSALFVGGAAGLLDDLRPEEISAIGA